MDRCCDSWGEATRRQSTIFSCEGLPERLIGAEICEDLLTVPLPPGVNLARGGAHVNKSISAGIEMVGKDSYRRDLVKGSLPDWCMTMLRHSRR